jgi:broad specificity phosphatase PhoE
MIIVDTQNQPIEHSIQDNNSEQGQKLYELNISVTRHGPKESLGGSLSSEGKESVLRYYQQAWHNLPAKSDTPRKLISSPINRAVQTANIFKLVLQQKSGNSLANLEVEMDERLSEKDLIGFIGRLEPHQTEWFEAWYISDFGKQAVAEFSAWVLEQIENQKLSGGSLEIDAFSHGPVMAAFALHMEDALGQKLLEEAGPNQSRFDITKLFSGDKSPFGYLGIINLATSSKNPDFINISVDDKVLSAPVDILRNI